MSSIDYTPFPTAFVKAGDAVNSIERKIRHARKSPKAKVFAASAVGVAIYAGSMAMLVARSSKPEN